MTNIDSPTFYSSLITAKLEGEAARGGLDIGKEKGVEINVRNTWYLRQLLDFETIQSDPTKNVHHTKLKELLSTSI